MKNQVQVESKFLFIKFEILKPGAPFKLGVELVPQVESKFLYIEFENFETGGRFQAGVGSLFAPPHHAVHHATCEAYAGRHIELEHLLNLVAGGAS